MEKPSRRCVGTLVVAVVMLVALSGCATTVEGSPGAADLVGTVNVRPSAPSGPAYASSTSSPPATPAPADPFNAAWAAREVSGSQDGYGLQVIFSSVGDQINAIVTYPELECGGVWLSDRRSGNTIELTEHITYGSCVKNTDVRITNNGDTLDFQVTWSGQEIHATLEPTDQVPLYDIPSSTGEASGREVIRQVHTGFGTATYSGTSQWVGCDTPAVTSYQLGGQYKSLTATPAIRDGADRDIAVRFVIQADNQTPQTTTVRIGDIPRPLELDVADAQTLTVSATRTSGGCSNSNDAFGVLLGAVLTA